MTTILAGSVLADVDIAAYSVTALKKAAYRLAEQCTVIFRTRDDGRMQLEFSVPPGGSHEDLDTAVRAFFREALDYELREKIAAETAPIRNVILAHAFARTRLADPPGS